eukprot:12448415-Prorocentrum_lima.AAC.1
MGRNIERAKIELKDEAISSEVWSWPKTQHRALIGYRSLGKKGNLIPVFLQLGYVQLGLCVI